MSNYIAAAYHPVEKRIRAAYWLDNHFGRFNYGVRFPGSDRVFYPAEVTIPVEVVFVPEPGAVIDREADATIDRKPETYDQLDKKCPRCGTIGGFGCYECTPWCSVCIAPFGSGSCPICKSNPLDGTVEER